VKGFTRQALVGPGLWQQQSRQQSDNQGQHHGWQCQARVCEKPAPFSAREQARPNGPAPAVDFSPYLGSETIGTSWKGLPAVGRERLLKGIGFHIHIFNVTVGRNPSILEMGTRCEAAGLSQLMRRDQQAMRSGFPPGGVPLAHGRNKTSH